MSLTPELHCFFSQPLCGWHTFANILICMHVYIYIYIYIQYMIMIAIPQRIGIPVKSNPKIVIKWHRCKVCMFFWCFLGPWIKAGSTCGDDCPKHSPSFQWFRRELPSGNGWHSYWKCWFIVDLPIENGDFP